MSVAVEDKSGATRPKMPDSPEHSLLVEFIEAISGINTGSNKGVRRWRIVWIRRRGLGGGVLWC